MKNIYMSHNQSAFDIITIDESQKQDIRGRLGKKFEKDRVAEVLVRHYVHLDVFSVVRESIG